MNNELKKHGFSLVEVLMASGILAVGLLMVAGTFPVGIFLTAAAVEQTIAPIVADEAFAKIQLYGIDPNINNIRTDQCVDFNNVNAVRALGTSYYINGTEYLYPSDSSIPVYSRVYSWSAICRRVYPNDTLVQITVFVSRKTGNGLWYYRMDPSIGNIAATYGSQPSPVQFDISTAVGNRLTISNVTHQKFITDGCTIVANTSGNIYRVLEHNNLAGNVEVVLDKDWNVNDSIGVRAAWLVPPPVSGGRSPVIGVYQRIIKF